MSIVDRLEFNLEEERTIEEEVTRFSQTLDVDGDLVNF